MQKWRPASWPWEDCVGRLKLQMQITVDGMNPDGENEGLSWDEVKDYSLELLKEADTIVLGSKTAGEFIPYWDRTAEKPDDPWHEIGKLISEARKVVFSRSIDGKEWNNTTVERGDLAPAIERLKRDTTRDIIAYGGVSFVASLVAHQLIDEFHLLVNPVALGSGRSIFAGLGKPQSLRLQKAVALKSGHVLLHYH